MINELAVQSAIMSIQKAMSSKTEADGGKHIREAIHSLDKSLSLEASVQVMSAANYIMKNPDSLFIKSGCNWIDYALGGGAREEELILIGGEFHSGKTHIMSYVGSQFMIEGKSVLYFVGEDLVNDIIGIFKNSLLAASGDDNLEGLFYVDVMETGMLNLAVIDSAVSQQKTDIVIIDHMDIMDTENKGQDWLEVCNISRELKFLAKKHNSIFIVGSQAIDGRLFRGNSSKSQSPDVIWYIEEIMEGLIQLEVKKGRGRRIKRRKVSLECNFDTMQIKGDIL